jgi:hypothetical protein
MKKDLMLKLATDKSRYKPDIEVEIGEARNLLQRIAGYKCSIKIKCLMLQKN